jgi:hypothetical protein
LDADQGNIHGDDREALLGGAIVAAPVDAATGWED